jgi:hypothetical protein
MMLLGGGSQGAGGSSYPLNVEGTRRVVNRRAESLACRRLLSFEPWLLHPGGDPLLFWGGRGLRCLGLWSPEWKR